MTAHNHRRAAAAAARRFQPKFPIQLEPRFDPTATFSQFSQFDTPTTDPFGVGNIFSNLFPTDTTSTVTSTVIVTPSLPSTTSTTPTSTTTSTTTASTTTVVAPTSTTPTTTRTTAATSTITSAPGDVAGQTSTVIRTISTSRSVSSTAAAASATTSDTSSSGVSTGAVVGGIGAGIVAIAAIGFAIVYFLRRARKSNTDNAEVTFNPSDFRRSAMLMEDPPTHEDTIAHGFNPRPPTMIERRLAAPVVSFGTQYGAPGSLNGGYAEPDHQGGQGGQYPSFGPDYYASSVSSPMSLNSANPLMPPAVYAQSPFSPIGSPESSHMPMYNERGEPIQAGYLTRQPSYGANLARQPSYGATLTRQQSGGSSAAQLSRQPSAAAMSMYPGVVQTAMRENQPQYANPGVVQMPAPPIPQETLPVNDYVDLSRSSVSPFQAQQYAEISRRLNTDIPSGLDTPALNDIVEKTRESAAEHDLPPVPRKESNVSPFADPAVLPTNKSGRPASSDSTAQDYDFPVPPSPAATFSSRYRIDSTPPTLPEIHVESRVSVSSLSEFTTHGGSPAPSPLGSGFPSGMTLTTGRSLATFPVTPSPLASSFGMITPPVEKTFERELLPQSSSRIATTTAAPAAAPAASARDPKPESERPNTVYSMYDPDDAYGGI